MKYYLFYLKHNKSLYAFTAEKQYREEFLKQRNPKCFIVKKVKLNGEEEKIFLYTNRGCKLNRFPYQTEKGYDDYVMLVATQNEDNQIDEAIRAMESDIDRIIEIFERYNVKNKYVEAMYNLTRIYDNNGHISIDVLSLFIKLFENTFIVKT